MHPASSGVRRLTRSSPLCRTLAGLVDSHVQSFDNEEKAKVFANFFEAGQPMWASMAELYDAERSSPPGEILDLGSGPGEPACYFAAKYGAPTIASDLAPAMVSLAERRVAARGLADTVKCVVLDMEDLSSIEDASHELVMGQMSYMFVPDKALALRETMRVLKPGGLLIANVWNSFDLVTLAGGMMQAVTGGPAGPPGGAPPPPNPNGPMSLAEPELFDALLRDAGFDLSAKSHNHVAPLTAPLGKLGDEQAFKVRTPLCRREKARAEGRRGSLGTSLDFPLWQLAREREHPTTLSPLSFSSLSLSLTLFSFLASFLPLTLFSFLASFLPHHL